MLRPIVKQTSIFLGVVCLHLALTGQAVAQNDAAAGQADLDEATELKLEASSMADLERVIELCETAIEKGLDDDSEALAKSLAAATLFQHGSRFASALFDRRERPQRPAMLKQFALRDLERVLKYDETIAQVHMMIARLQSVNVGRGISQADFEKGLASADKAVELLADDDETRSKALVLRAGYSKTSQERVEFLNKAIEADRKNTDAWRLRGKNRLVEGELLSAAGQLERAREIREQAVADFTALLKENPEDPDALQAVAELLGRLGNYEEALANANKAIERNPQAASLFILRGRLYQQTNELDKAIQDLNRAIDLQPDSFIAFLDRAEMKFEKGDKSAAGKDYGRARELQGRAITRTVFQRLTVRTQNDYSNAIEALKKYIEIDDIDAEDSDRDPDPDYRLQLGQTYLAAKKEGLAVTILDELIGKLGDNPGETRLKNARLLSLRTRADAHLGLGQHKKAVTDYDAALKIQPTEDGVLNNLAWVLATSPKEGVRNADRAIELATKACKVTDYKQAHILSTLAAAHAESGDFDKAIEWSSKAVELGGETLAPETQSQLKAELESYKQKKPWRELQGPEAEGANTESTPDAGDSE